MYAVMQKRCASYAINDLLTHKPLCVYTSLTYHLCMYMHVRSTTKTNRTLTYVRMHVAWLFIVSIVILCSITQYMHVTTTDNRDSYAYN